MIRKEGYKALPHGSSSAQNSDTKFFHIKLPIIVPGAFGKRKLVNKEEDVYEQSVTINSVEFFGDAVWFSDLLGLLLHDSDESVLQVVEAIDQELIRDLET
ncbi:MAG: hypothetical protein AAB921_03260, partial [Patescibacteria group bacterium]